MSTQSPTPTPKAPRSNRRSQKQNATPSTQQPALLATPPSSPPRNLSPGATDSSNNLNTSKKKRVRSTNKKPREMPKASPAQKNNHQHTSSNPASSATPQVNSPHYAGPTFHASPAPSALPMPSFLSKSMPDSEMPPVVESETDNYGGEPDLDATPSKPKSRPQHLNEEPQPSPLDFLFKAAVEARNGQQQRSPERSVQLRSPQTDSKALHRKSPGPGGMFPFEMEGHESYHSQIGPSFAPSYQDRMNALRSSNPSSPQAGDENQRRMQTEAVKNLLLNPRPQRPTSTSNSHNNFAVSLDQRQNGSPNIPHYATPLRTNSGPPTAPSGAPLDQHRTRNFCPPHSSSKQPPRSHNQMFCHDGNPTTVAVSSPHGRYEQSHRSVNHNSQPMYSPARHQSPTTRPVQGSPSAQGLDTKKIEDDLRRILKLDVNPGFPSSSIQSSYA